jgi:hypothetical protein
MAAETAGVRGFALIFPISKEQIGLWVLLTGIIMLFCRPHQRLHRPARRADVAEHSAAIAPLAQYVRPSVSSFTLELAKGAIRKIASRP